MGHERGPRLTPVASHFVDTAAEDPPSGIQAVAEKRAKALERIGDPNRFMVSAVQRLLADVCETFGVQVSAVHSRDRHRKITQARHAFWWLARQFWEFSYPELGRLIGEDHAFDHTTVMHGVWRVGRALDQGTPYGHTVRCLVLGVDPGRVTNGVRCYDECRGPTIELDTATGDSSGPMSSSASKEGSAQ